MHESEIYLKPVGFVPASLRRRAERSRLEEDTVAARHVRSLARQLETKRSEYRRQLSEIMGRSNIGRYRQLRREISGSPRAKRLRESRKMLQALGFDRARAERLRDEYLTATRALVETRTPDRRPPRRLPLDECTPWVTYTAPYHGFFWSYVWDRSDEADDPILTRYLDTATGHIGSRIATRLSGADDDDFLNVDYYTSLNVWHTVQASGPLEGYVAFEFNASPYSGKVQDEFGFSNATFSQFALARLRAADPQGPTDIQDGRVFNFIDTDWGDGRSWNNFVSAPQDRHWYYFRTAVGFEQGRAVLLEAGILNTTWFTANDESITTTDDIDLRLDRIMVRSCPGPVIL